MTFELTWTDVPKENSDKSTDDGEDYPLQIQSCHDKFE